ncbi:TetR family transcriptional regulator [Paenibacillus mesophilus]|uniref:TetR/AcrR family transcriptional regulator n=1 Tax=Paenibacillus mesophilus TaxID=2582849 RepID=UPI00110E6732|nr:TetR/AcrR family transcriptional regulator [Paenibacillus mesophilus]TMV46852.1 TetR family transcriptional regulator [Paenibacillus mesophilus]
MPRIGLDLPTLLQAAADIADTEGIDGLSLATLAKKLNVRTPSLYNHVDGLPGLRAKLSVYGLELLHGKLTDAAVGRSGDDAIRAFGNAYLAFARSRPGLYDLTLRAPDPHAPDVVQAGKKLVDLLVRLMEGYGLEGDDALHAIRGLRSALHGFASLEQKGGFGMPLDLDKSFRLLLDALLAGLHAIRSGGPVNEVRR